MVALRKDFEEFLAKKSPTDTVPSEINVNKLQQLLMSHLRTELKGHPILSHEFTHETLADTSKLILSAVYSSQTECFKIHHLVATVSVLQHLLHSELGLPPTVAAKTTRLLRFQLTHTPFEALHGVYEEVMASSANQQFHQQTFPSAFTHRCLALLKGIGFYPKNMAMPLHILKTLVEQEREAEKACGEWVALCLAYLLLWLKFEQFKQKAIFFKLLSQAEGRVEGEEVMGFYNRVFLGTVGRVERNEWLQWVETVEVDHYVASELVGRLFLIQ